MIADKLRQIQAVSTQTGTTPDGLSGLTVWLKADVGILDGSGNAITANGTAIITWQNQASGGTHYTSDSRIGRRPTYRDGSNGKNGLPVVDFSGANLQSMTHADTSAYSTGGITIFTICKWTSGQVWSVYDGAVAATYPVTSYHPRYITGGDGTTNFATPNDDGYTEWNYTRFASNIGVSYDYYPYGTPGTITTAGFASRGAAQTADCIGKRPDLADYFTGQIGEIIIYNRKLTDTECATIKTYLLNRWGMASGDNVALLLHMDGTNGSTTFTDSSQNNQAVTTLGSASITTSGQQFGTGAGNFNGTSSYLTVANNAINACGLQDFSIECWVNFSALPSTNQIMGIANVQTSASFATNAMWWFGLEDSAGSKRLRLGRHGDASVYAHTAWTPSLNTWYFLQATRSGTTISLGVDGVSKTVTSSGSNWNNNFSANGTLAVGFMATVLAFNGKIDEFRLTKGVARAISLPSSAFSNS